MLRIIIFCCSLFFFKTLILAQEKRKSPSKKEIKGESCFIEAEKYYLLEEFEKALKTYEKCSEKDVNNQTLFYKIAKTYDKLDDIDNALTNAINALELDDSNKYYHELVANLYTKKGDLDNASLTYKKLINTIPKTESYLYELALLLLYQQKYSEALKIYNKIENFYGYSEEITSQKQEILLKNNNHEQAIIEGYHLISIFPENENIIIKQVELLLKYNKKNEAKTLLGQTLEKHPNYTHSKLILGEIMRLNGNEIEAFKYINEVFEDPNFDVRYKIDLIGKFGMTKDSVFLKKFVIPLCDKMIRYHNKNAEVHIIFGDILQKTNDYEHAKNEYTKSIQYDQSKLEVWLNIIQLHFRLNQLDSAAIISESALEYFPNQGRLYYFGGVAYLQKGKNKKAIRLLELGSKITQSDKTISHLFYPELGNAYNNVGDYTKSDNAYNKALENNPNDDFVLNNYSYFLSLREENLEKAEIMSKAVITRNPNNITFLDTYAWVLFKLNKLKEAENVMKKIMNLGSTTAIYHEHYGDILFKLGKKNLAIEQWKKAKELNPKTPMIDQKINQK